MRKPDFVYLFIAAFACLVPLVLWLVLTGGKERFFFVFLLLSPVGFTIAVLVMNWRGITSEIVESRKLRGCEKCTREEDASPSPCEKSMHR